MKSIKNINNVNNIKKNQSNILSIITAITTLFLAMIFTLSLSGCATTSAATGKNRTNTPAVKHSKQAQSNPIETYYDDSNISFAVNQRIRNEPILQNDTHIAVAVYHNIVLLAGQVITSAQRIKAQQLARSVPNVGRIYNEIAVAGPTTTLTRSSDAWITSKVKSDMLFTKQLKSRKIKIVTENGVVYLLGVVTQNQAHMASNVTRRVQGVQKVVTLFEIA